MNFSRLMKTTLAGLLCGGCASAPVNYYTLVPPISSSRAVPAAGCCSVEIKRVRIPAEVDRPELVTRRSGQQLTVLGNDLWLAPLRDEIRSGLMSRIDDRLAESVPAGSAPAEPASPGSALSAPPARSRKFLVFVDVDRFESEPARYALVQADWRVESIDSAKGTAPTCETTAQVDVQSGVSALVLGHQQAIAQVADQIARYILDAERTGAPHCAAGVTPNP